MKLFFKIILIGVLAFGIQQIFSWWTAALMAALVAALVPTSGFKAFISGFLGVGLLWLVLALVSSVQTDYLLTDKVAGLMGLSSSYLLILITFVIGALLGGLGAWTGNQLRQLLRTDSAGSTRHKRSRRRY